MRLWSISPKYLDQKGLVAVWREGLLAKKVLQGKTIGYKKHPQLERFKKNSKKIRAINNYLYYIYLEAKKRNYNFDKTKCKNYNLKKIITINQKQLEYEFKHLNKKLLKRNKKKYLENKKNFLENKKILANALFEIVEGEIEYWENKII